MYRQGNHWNRAQAVGQFRGTSYDLVNLAQAAGVQLAWGEAQSIIRSGRAWRYAQQLRDRIREEARNPRDQSSLERRIGPGDMATTSKRPRPEDSTKINVVTAGTVNDTYVKRTVRSKRSKKPKNMRRYLINQFIKNSTQEALFRWQGISKFEQNAMRTYPLLNTTYGTTQIQLPVYAFNLSALPLRGAGPSGASVTLRSIPMYRLVKDCYATGAITASNQNYSWVKQVKQFGSNEATTQLFEENEWMDQEKNESNAFCDTYMHNWSDIKLMLQARRKFQTRIHIYIVSFLNECGPRRKFWEINGVNFTERTEDTTVVDTDIQCSNDHFWDRFLQRKVVHPLACAMQPDKRERHLAIHHHEICELPCENSDANDSKVANQMRKISYKNNDTYKVTCAIEEETTGFKMVYDNNPVPANGLENPPGWPYKSGIRSEDTKKSPYVTKASADKWLLIVGETYVRDADINTDNYNSFDLVVRSKFTYYAKP